MTRRSDEVPPDEHSFVDDKTEDMPVLQQWVVVATGVDARPDTLIFAAPIVVGSDPECDIVIDHSTVSPRHLRLVPSERSVVVQDLSDVAGRSAATDTELKAGQELVVGAAALSIKRTW